MRKKFVFFVLVPFVTCLLLVYLFLDSWVESGLEHLGERAVGARVEIDDLHLSLSPLGIEFSRLQVTNKRDTWKNLFETGTVKFAMDFNQLLRGKYVIETMEVNDLVLGTQRAADGALPSPPPRPEPDPAAVPLTQKVESAVEQKVSQAPVLDIQKLRRGLNIDSLLNVQNLQTVRHLDSLKQLVQRVRSQWDDGLNEVEQSKQRLAQIEASLRSIRPQELKTIDQITAALTTVQNASTTVSDVTTSLNNRRVGIANDVTRLAGAVNGINDVLNRDYQSLSRLARLPDVSMMGIAELLFGKALYEDVLEYLSWADFLNQNIPGSSSVPEKSSPPRLEGQTIRFPSERSYPKFWIKKMVISGGTDSTRHTDYYYVRGAVEHISSNQKLAGFPLSAELTATRGGITTVLLSASFDRRADVSRDEYRARATGVSVGNVSLGRSDFLPSRITNARSAISVGATFAGGDFEGTAGVDISNMTLSLERPARTVVEQLSQRVLESVRSFRITLRIWETDGILKMALSTDLDDQLANQARRVIGEEVARIQNEIRSKLQQKVAEKRREFERFYQQKRSEGLARVKELEDLSTKNLALVQSKRAELEARVEQETKKQTDDAKKKLEDAVKGFLKKKQ